MTDYLLDTNHTSPLVTPGHPLREQILLELNSGSNFSVCVPVVTETLFGISLLSRAKQNLAEWERLKLSLPCIIPDEEDAEAAAKLQVALRRRGWQLATVDAFIAVVALRYNLILLTTDKDYQEIPNLRQENWLFAKHG